MIKQMGSSMSIVRILLMLPMIFMLSGCFDREQEQINSFKPIVESRISSLQMKLKSGQIRNAVLLKAYASKLRGIKPDLTELCKAFELDAYPNGPAIKGFKERLQIVNFNPASFGSKKAIIEELKALGIAVHPEIYNNSLVDVINTLSELSEGALPKISEPKGKKQDEKNNGSGSRLVGNPTYGNWQTSNGQSFWVWYGQYSMFRSLWGRPYYYHSWYYNRPWSYYNDHGRSMYSSRSQRTRNSSLKTTNQRKLKEYGAKSGRNYSTYSATKANSKFKPATSSSSRRSNSSYQTKTSSRNSSPYSASHRTGTRSRSSFGGK